MNKKEHMKKGALIEMVYCCAFKIYNKTRSGEGCFSVSGGL